MRCAIGYIFIAACALLAPRNVVLAAAQQHADGATTAQPRSRPAPNPPATQPQANQPPATSPQVNQPPATEPRFQSTLKFDPRPASDGASAVPLVVDRFGRPFGFVSPVLRDRRVRMGGIAVGVAPLAFPLPSDAAPGGVQLDVQPWGAQVYVDGTYVGVVRDFTGYYHHLEVSAGPHVIAIVEPDYEPLILEVFVTPGQVITHRGTLSRASGR